MDRVRELIDKYHLVKRGNKIGTYQTQGIDVDEFQREVGAYKTEIMAYFVAQEEAARQAARQRELTFESIPGVKEIRNARYEWSMYHAEFNRIMEAGESIFPPAPSVDLKSLERAYPDAVFALMVESKTRSENYEISGIAQRAYDALCNGESVVSVKAKYDAAMEDFVERHTFD